MPELVRVGYRALDRQWIIPDPRLIARPRPVLWSMLSERQVFVIEQHARPITAGPALIFTSLLPDMDHFMGHHGGRVLPLYRDKEAVHPNLTPGLLGFLSELLCRRVDELDVVAYLAAIVGHPGFVQRFAGELRRPGLRIPITRDSALWSDAVRVGNEVLWLHTYGERCTDSEVGRPSGPPRMHANRPTVQVGIPDTEDGMPEQMTYDSSTRTLHVGHGQIAPVAPEVWNYQVSGMWVLRHWFGYRKKHPSGKRSSPLDEVVATTWTTAMTTELLQLLNVLGRCVALEARQEDLLGRIAESPLVTVEDLTVAGILPVPSAVRRAPRPHRQEGLF